MTVTLVARSHLQRAQQALAEPSLLGRSWRQEPFANAVAMYGCRIYTSGEYPDTRPPFFVGSCYDSWYRTHGSLYRKRSSDQRTSWILASSNLEDGLGPLTCDSSTTIPFSGDSGDISKKLDHACRMIYAGIA